MASHDEPKKASGTFSEPPPGAPHQVTQPVGDMTDVLRAKRAQQAALGLPAEEKELAPLKFESRPTISAPSNASSPDPNSTPSSKSDTANSSPSGAATPWTSPHDGPELQVRDRLEANLKKGAGQNRGKPMKVAKVQPKADPEPPVTEQRDPAAATDPDLMGWAEPSTPDLSSSTSETKTSPTEPAELGPIVAPTPYDPNDDPVEAKPTRGQPKPILDRGKQITGGFGDPGGEAFYAPLDGTEVWAIAKRIADELIRRAQNDLRFSMAVVYPRVSVRVVLEVQGFGEERGIAIDRVETYEKNPIDLARTMGEEVCFVVRAGRREVDEAGQPETAPNAMRDEIGAEIPKKQRVQDAGGNWHWIDQRR